LAPPPERLGEPELADAAGRVERLDLDAVRNRRLAAEVLGTALIRLRRGVSNGARGRILGYPATERDLRFGLEKTYRDLATLANDPPLRIRYVDQANQVRPRTWF
ncbi:MAG: tetratricopeptide repeat protein, partial [Micromonosporaceae bacterium]